MKILILCPYWGHEHLDIEDFLMKIAAHEFDGVDTWIPVDKEQRLKLYRYADVNQFPIVAHQHRASGATFAKFCKSFERELQRCAEAKPVLINSHTGRDAFSREQFIQLLDIAQHFSEKTGIAVSHETHRGRFAYAPQMLAEYLDLYPELAITADFSHWTCVTESMLGDFDYTLNQTIRHARAIHARIGYEQGPQIPDPADATWEPQKQMFCSWWDKIIKNAQAKRFDLLPITTEFGPFPYMTITDKEKAMTSQFEFNLYMKNLIRARYPASV